jgi:UDP-glucuronate 4-epimerase
MSPFRFVKWIDKGRELVLYGDGLQTGDFTYKRFRTLFEEF